MAAPCGICPGGGGQPPQPPQNPNLSRIPQPGQQGGKKRNSPAQGSTTPPAYKNTFVPPVNPEPIPEIVPEVVEVEEVEYEPEQGGGDEPGQGDELDQGDDVDEQGDNGDDQEDGGDDQWEDYDDGGDLEGNGDGQGEADESDDTVVGDEEADESDDTVVGEGDDDDEWEDTDTDASDHDDPEEYERQQRLQAVGRYPELDGRGLNLQEQLRELNVALLAQLHVLYDGAQLPANEIQDNVATMIRLYQGREILFTERVRIQAPGVGPRMRFQPHGQRHADARIGNLDDRLGDLLMELMNQELYNEYELERRTDRVQELLLERRDLFELIRIFNLQNYNDFVDHVNAGGIPDCIIDNLIQENNNLLQFIGDQLTTETEYLANNPAELTQVMTTFSQIYVRIRALVNWRQQQNMEGDPPRLPVRLMNLNFGQEPDEHTTELLDLINMLNANPHYTDHELLLRRLAVERVIGELNAYNVQTRQQFLEAYQDALNNTGLPEDRHTLDERITMCNQVIQEDANLIMDDEFMDITNLEDYEDEITIYYVYRRTLIIARNAQVPQPQGDPPLNEPRLYHNPAGGAVADTSLLLQERLNNVTTQPGYNDETLAQRFQAINDAFANRTLAIQAADAPHNVRVAAVRQFREIVDSEPIPADQLTIDQEILILNQALFNLLYEDIYDNESVLNDPLVAMLASVERLYAGRRVMLQERARQVRRRQVQGEAPRNEERSPEIGPPPVVNEHLNTIHLRADVGFVATEPHLTDDELRIRLVDIRRNVMLRRMHCANERRNKRVREAEATPLILDVQIGAYNEEMRLHTNRAMDQQRPTNEELQQSLDELRTTYIRRRIIVMQRIREARPGHPPVVDPRIFRRGPPQQNPRLDRIEDINEELMDNLNMLRTEPSLNMQELMQRKAAIEKLIRERMRLLEEEEAAQAGGDTTTSESGGDDDNDNPDDKEPPKVTEVLAPNPRFEATTSRTVHFNSPNPDGSVTGVDITLTTNPSNTSVAQASQDVQSPQITKSFTIIKDTPAGKISVTAISPGIPSTSSQRTPRSSPPRSSPRSSPPRSSPRSSPPRSCPRSSPPRSTPGSIYPRSTPRTGSKNTSLSSNGSSVPQIRVTRVRVDNSDPNRRVTTTTVVEPRDITSSKSLDTSRRSSSKIKRVKYTRIETTPTRRITTTTVTTPPPSRSGSNASGVSSTRRPVERTGEERKKLYDAVYGTKGKRSTALVSRKSSKKMGSGTSKASINSSNRIHGESGYRQQRVNRKLEYSTDEADRSGRSQANRSGLSQDSMSGGNRQRVNRRLEYSTDEADRSARSQANRSGSSQANRSGSSQANRSGRSQANRSGRSQANRSGSSQGNRSVKTPAGEDSDYNLITPASKKVCIPCSGKKSTSSRSPNRSQGGAVARQQDMDRLIDYPEVQGRETSFQYQNNNGVANIRLGRTQHFAVDDAGRRMNRSTDGSEARGRNIEIQRVGPSRSAEPGTQTKKRKCRC